MEQIPLLQKREDEMEYKYRNDEHYQHNFKGFPLNLLTDPNREKLPIKIVCFLRNSKPIDGRYYYFFALRKKYPLARFDWIWGESSVIFGWMVKEPGKKAKIIKQTMSFIDGDGSPWGKSKEDDFAHEAYDLFPIGLFKADGKIYWVLHGNYNEAEDFSIVETGTEQVRVILPKN